MPNPFVPRIRIGASYAASKALPHIQSITDIQPGIKNIVIEGIRGDGALVIPGGRPSYNITVQGILLSSDTTLPDGTAYATADGTNYEKLTEQMDWLRTYVVTDETHLYVEKTDATYADYTVRRLGDIGFRDSLRTSVQEYSISFRRI